MAFVLAKWVSGGGFEGGAVVSSGFGLPEGRA
jgi:hypothetical protein